MLDFVVNKISNSITYIIPTSNQNECYIVDCGDVEGIISKGWLIKGVLLTHAHTDHIYGINKLLDIFPDALIYTNEEGKSGLLNPRWNLSHYHYDVEDIVIRKTENIHVLNDECTLELSGNLLVDIIFTPGHDPSSITYRIADCLFTGDSYIPGVKVVTSFPRSNKQQAEQSLVCIHDLEKAGLKIMSGHWLP